MTNVIGSLPSGCHIGFDKLILQENGYEVKCGLSTEELQNVYQLRAKIFCNELRWVGSPNDELEIDEFDELATHLAVIENGEIIACLRIHPYYANWMACTVFHDLLRVPPKAMKTPDACEVSRLALAPEHRHRRLKDGTEPAEALYRGLFAFCTLKQVRYVYMIVSLPVLRSLRRHGLPCEAIISRKKMEDGVIALAGRLDWVRFFEINRRHNPNRLDRFLATLTKTTEIHQALGENT
jgi:N-acyl-L-homoserine lactone synthetase